MNTNKNQRFQETHQRLIEAALQCMEKEPQKEITVRKLCEIVGINRSSFYLHFLDVPAMLEEMENSLFMKAIPPVSIVSDPAMSESGKDEKGNADVRLLFLQDGLSFVLKHIQENRILYLYIFKNDPQWIHNSSNLLYCNYIQPALERLGLPENDSGRRKMNYYFSFFWSGFLQVVFLWLQEGCPETPEEISGVILNLTKFENLPD